MLILAPGCHKWREAVVEEVDKEKRTMDVWFKKPRRKRHVKADEWTKVENVAFGDKEYVLPLGSDVVSTFLPYDLKKSNLLLCLA